MFKLVQCAKNTYYLKCYSNIGVYDLGNSQVVLIDSGDHKKSVTDLCTALEERNWRVKTILCTHSHADHIWGNKLLSEKYGCDIYAADIEYVLACKPDFDASIYYNGIPIGAKGCKPYMAAPCDVKPVTEAVLPEGFEIMALPGHTFNMMGIKTPDGVWFIGDAILPKELFESYKLPFFFHINTSIETARMLERLDGKYFVASHCEPSESISALARYNADRLEEMKDYFYELCDGKSFDEIFAAADKELDLCVNIGKYAKLAVSVRSFLQSLIEDDRIFADVENSVLIYRKV